MIIKSPHLLTKLEIWAPKYSDVHEGGERVALLATYRVDHATPTILVQFTKAKHLIGQRFAIDRKQAQNCLIVTNGRIPCYAVPMSMLASWETPGEVADTAMNIFN